MAGKYCTEFQTTELKDVQASAMAVDCLGQWTLLAGRKNLVFVDLNRPALTTVKVTRQSKWGINCVQWNGHASHAYRFVTACNQRLDLFDFHEASATHLCSLKAHSRTISAVDWSPFDVNVVASCSLDTYTYFWDVRDSKKPVKTFQAVSGVGQVKWNKVTNNLFATTHDGDVRIWDPRKGNTPVQYISAHPSKIHGLDWSSVDQHKLVTASQDCTIRFWDYTNPRRCEAMINSGNPVWRATYTPFGEGVVSVVVPQLRRVENNLYLWHIRNQQSPVHTFIGHKDVVLEFQWRRQQEGVKDHQLITWSKDQTLRIWKVDTSMQKLCGYDIEDNGDAIVEQEFSTPLPQNLLFDLYKKPDTLPTDNRLLIAPKSDTSGVGASAPNVSSHLSMMSSMLSAMTLEEECADIGQMSGVKLELADLEKRTLTFKLVKEQHFMDIHMLFPDTYPIRVPPHLTILQTNLDSEIQQHVVKTFNETSSVHVKKHTNCLKHCFKQILNVMEKSGSLVVNQENTTLGEERKSVLDKKFLVEKVRAPTSPVGQSSVPMYPSGSFHDSCIPFPRTCGATFCSNDYLVMFHVPAALKKVSEDSEITPRALSDLASYSHPQSQWMRNQSNSFVSSLSLFYGSPPATAQEVLSVSSFYTEKTTKSRHHRSHQKSRSKDREGRHEKEREADRASKKMHKVGCVKIYDISPINNISKYAGQHYKLDLDDLHGTCKQNAEVASKMKRNDLIQLWQLVDHMTHEQLRPSPNLEDGAPWAFRPFGRPLLKKMMDHYTKSRDVQTLAMLCCVFWDREKPKRDVLSLITTSSRNDSHLSVTNVPEITLASSSDSGWNLLRSTAAALLPHPAPMSPSPVLSPVHPLPPSSSPSSTTSSSSVALGKGGRTMAEVASQPNLAVLFRAGRNKAGRSSAVMKSKRSFSWSESYEDFKVSEEKEPKDKMVERERQHHHNNCKMLDPEQKSHYEEIKKAYANILFKWGLLTESAHILKHTDGGGVEHQTIGCPVSCFNCSTDIREVQCHICKYPALRCAICHMSVRGLSEVCLACGHGGHTSHMIEWFTHQSFCPTGCGCMCLQENSLHNFLSQGRIT
ncbi:GATOR complex protein WDR59-like isoform X2 [Biomphalaria glabrata]|uniref:GATOR complex protein WDR59-like isoform X2 n=1 Tax=Biomphalaria glabrata TaxID=6526 RepID=A0A9W3AW68_BIOGL|nr:GATOR complex protein WDR59-like isoform X2 [Biomphalaria glabrata]